MRIFLAAAALVPLSACIGGSSGISPVSAPKGSTGVMYTNTAAQNVSECVARVVGNPVQIEGGATSIASRATDRSVRYVVQSAPAKSGYQTMVATFGGLALNSESAKVAGCL